jgi:hypothetical protein
MTAQICGVVVGPLIQLLIGPLGGVLLVCVIFGGFGGCVAHWINNEKQTLTTHTTLQEGWFLYPSSAKSVAIGAAGAIAFIFFIVAVGGLTTFQALAEQLRFIAVCVIAGFGARSLLPRMVGHLEKQVEQAKTDAVEAKTKAETASEAARAAIEKVEEVNLNMKLLEAAHPKAPPNLWKESLALAQVAMLEGTAKPVIWINAARVQRWHGSYTEAIKTLTDAINRFESGRLQQDKNYAAAYYNRACYYEQLYKTGDDPEGRNKALRDVEAALRVSHHRESDIAEMRVDDDLAEVVMLPEFETIVRKW